MKITHISTQDFGGAGMAALRLHEALLAQGVESRMLVREKRSGNHFVVQLESVYNSPSVLGKAFRLLYRRRWLPLRREQLQRKAEQHSQWLGVFFSSPITRYRHIAQHELVKNADIVHLHWVANFLDYETFFSKIGKPIVWTIHDENIKYGGFHYTSDYLKVGKTLAKLERRFTQSKEEALIGRRICAIALTEKMRSLVTHLPIAKDWTVSVISNPLSPLEFTPIDKATARQHFGISEQATVIMFCCIYLPDKRKGLLELIESIEKLNDPNVELLCVGDGPLPKDTHIKTTATGPLTSIPEMIAAYSASDIYATPAFEEAFGQTTVEALYCGCPVVAFPTGIAREIVDDSCGMVCRACNQEALTEALLQIQSRKYNKECIRDSATKRFSPHIIARQHIDLYNKILNDEQH